MDGLRSDGDGLTISHGCSLSQLSDFEKLCLEGISEMSLLPLWEFSLCVCSFYLSIAFAPEIDCDHMAMGLPPVTSAVLLITK
jgi:hypothetical protein